MTELDLQIARIIGMVVGVPIIITTTVTVGKVVALLGSQVGMMRLKYKCRI